MTNASINVIKLLFFGLVISVYSYHEMLVSLVPLKNGVTAEERYVQLHIETQHIQLLLTGLAYLTILTSGAPWSIISILLALHSTVWGVLLTDNSFSLSETLHIDNKWENPMLEIVHTLLFAIILAAGLFWDHPVKIKHRDYRQELVDFYTQHNPSKLDDIDAILQKYKGHEKLLMMRLERKYSRDIDVDTSEPVVSEDTINQEVFPEFTDLRTETSMDQVELFEQTSSVLSVTSNKSKAVQSAIEEARRAQTQRIEERIAKMKSQKGK